MSTIALLALVALLAFAAGWIGASLVAEHTLHGGTLDLTAAAARGELWTDDIAARPGDDQR